MDIDKVRALTDTELVTELATAKRHLYDLRFQLATRQLTDYSQIPLTRRRIARILSVMTERQLSEVTVPAFVAATNGDGRTARSRARTAPSAAPDATAEPEPATHARASATATAARPRTRRTSETRTTESRTRSRGATADKKEKPAASRRTGTRRAGSTSK
jgi:large subunit ribosomal protein L29